MNLTDEFSRLSAVAIRDAVVGARSEGLAFDRDVFIPEADILMCRFHEKRFNVRVDLDYGADIDAIDPLTADETADIMRMIVAHAAPSA